MTGAKRCPHCDSTLPISAFSKNRAQVDGLSSYCRPCDYNRKAAWLRRTRTQRTEQAAQWRAANPAKQHAIAVRYRAAHPEKVRARVARRLARQLDAFVENIDIAELAQRDNGRCGVCGKSVVPAMRSVDHILPLSFGGEHSYANTRLTHLRCNIRRQDRGTAQLRMI